MTAQSTCPHDDDATTCPPCNRHLRPSSTPHNSFTTPIIAQYRSTCDACGAQIEEGDEIVRAADVYIHVDCLDPWG